MIVDAIGNDCGCIQRMENGKLLYLNAMKTDKLPNRDYHDKEFYTMNKSNTVDLPTILTVLPSRNKNTRENLQFQAASPSLDKANTP